MTMAEQVQEGDTPARGQALLLTAMAPAGTSEHRVLSSSAGASSLLGCSQQELLGSDLRQVLCEGQDGQTASAWEGLERQLASGQDGSAQLMLRSGSMDDPRGEAEARWLDVSVTALPGGRHAWACDPSEGPDGGSLQQPAQPPRAMPEVEGAAVLRALPHPVWVCDADGRVALANPALCRLLGRAAALAVGHPWTELLRPAHCDGEAVEALQAAMAEGTDAEAALACGHVSVTPLPDARGGPLLLCTLCEPPAAAPRPAPGAAAPAPAGGEGAGPAPPPLAQLCNQALAWTNESVVITDPTQPGNPIIYANKAFERLTGYSQAAALGRGHSFLQGPDTDPVVLADVAAALEEGRPIVAELVVYRADGSPFWSQFSITPIREGGGVGGVAHYVMVQRDVTQRKAAEAAFHMREQALSNLNEGITICDPAQKDCPVVYCNSAFLRITGYSRKEVIGTNCRFLQGPKTNAATVQRLATALHEGREVTVELLNYRKNGEEFYNMLSITPVRDASGRLLSFIGVQSDVTELTLRRQAEKELQEAKAAAETAAEAKSMFLANMSHEIRTPLNGMIAVAQMLLASGLSPEQRELGDMILESGNTLLTILGDILDFSKIDHNSMALEAAPLALRDTLEASIEMVAADAARKGLDVAYTLAPPLERRRLLGDSIRIRQVLANLLSNAVKFTSRGEVVVEAWVDEAPPPPPPTPAPVAAQELRPRQQQPEAESSAAADASAPPSPRPGPALHMTVRDTGIGISGDGIARLFQCFRQGHESMSRRYGGTGLGLAISRRLAELMGGNVWVESVEGQGSTFHFTMALEWEGGQGGSPALGASALKPGPALSLGGESVLASRRGSGSSDHPTRCSVSSSGSPMAAAAAAAAASAAAAADAGAGGGHPAEAQRVLLQQHHEALLQKLAQSSVVPGDAPLPTAAGAPAEPPPPGAASLRLSEGTDAPDTPHTLLRHRHAPSSVSAVSSSTVLASLAGSSGALPGLTAAGSGGSTAAPRSDTVQPSDASRRSSTSTQPAERRASADSATSGRRSRDSGDLARPPRPPPPTYDYRLSSFYAPSQLPAKARQAPPVPLPRRVQQQQQQQDSPPAPQQRAELAPEAPPPTDARRNSGDCGSTTSAPASGAPHAAAHAAAAAAAARPARGTCSAAATSPREGGDRLLLRGGGGEAAPLAGRHVVIDVAHGPTAAQVAQSCGVLGMVVELRPCFPAPVPAGAAAEQDEGAPRDFCITTPDKALQAVRSGWRGQPLVVLGRREELPLNLHAMVTTVSKPVKHTRLVGALLKATAFARSKERMPLHTDPQMLSLLPERLSLNRLAVNRRMSLDDSVLDRRRWQMMAAATAATAAAVRAAGDPEAPAPVRSSAPGLDGDARAEAAARRRSLEAEELPPSLASLQLEVGRPRGDAAAEGVWRPQLPAIPSYDSSARSSARNSLDAACNAAAAAVMAATAAAAAVVHPSRLRLAEPAAAPPPPPPTYPRPPSILVAEDNLINQRVISKVLQRVVPAATVTVVGNGALAVEAALRQHYDLCLMDIHMPEMDGLEASRCLQQQLPPERRPVIVALSADTLLVLHEKCKEAGIRQFICKPFRVEDVQRVLDLVRPRLMHPPGAAAAPTGSL